MPGQVFLGAADAAKNKPELLKRNGVTHVLNLAAATCPCPYPQLFTYKACAIDDDMHEQVDRVFDDCADFISQCVNGGGRVYVHCHAGVSRSATIVLYWLMRDRSLDLQTAYDLVKAQRDEICPNPGFFRSLSQAEERLFGKKTLNYEKYCIQLLMARVEGATEEEARHAFDSFDGNIVRAESWLWEHLLPP